MTRMVLSSCVIVVYHIKKSNDLHERRRHPPTPLNVRPLHVYQALYNPHFCISLSPLLTRLWSH